MIKKVKTFEELVIELRNARVDSLVIFDIDDVLVVAEDALFHPFNRTAVLKKQCFKSMKKHFPQRKGRSSGFYQLLSTVFLQGRRGLVHPSLPSLFNELHNKKINLLGLTKCEVGLFGKIDQLEEWKLNELNQANILFSNFFRKTNSFYQI